MKTIRFEWNRLRRNVAILVFFGVFLVISLFTFLLWGGRTFGVALYLGEDPVQVGKEAFRYGLTEMVLPTLVAVLFPGMYLGTLFEGRGISQDIVLGRSRISVFLTRILEVYLLSCLMCGSYPLVVACFYSFPWLASLDLPGWAALLGEIGYAMLRNMQLMGLGIVLGFLFRAPLLPPLISVGVFLAYVIVYPLSTIFGGREGVPARITHGLFSLLLSPENLIAFLIGGFGENLWASRALLGFLPPILISTGISWWIFRRADLK